jgi:hypothetical protein
LIGSHSREPSAKVRSCGTPWSHDCPLYPEAVLSSWKSRLAHFLPLLNGPLFEKL